MLYGRTVYIVYITYSNFYRRIFSSCCQQLRELAAHPVFSKLNFNQYIASILSQWLLIT